MTFPIPDNAIKLAVKRELLNTDAADLDVPVRSFLHKLLEGGGDEKLVKVIYRILRSKKSTGPMKLRAMEIIMSSMKHHEKMRPVPKDIKMMDKASLARYIDQKLGIETADAPEAAADAPPAWMQELEQADG